MSAAHDARWQALYQACRPTLYRSAALVVGEAEAEEVVQDAFERAMREPDFFGRVREPLAWLRTVSTRVALGRLRRRGLVGRAPRLARGRPQRGPGGPSREPQPPRACASQRERCRGDERAARAHGPPPDARH